MTPLHPTYMLSREQLRRRSVVGFFRALVPRHPELKQPITWDRFVAIAQREGITVRVRPLPVGHVGDLARIGSRTFIVISDQVPKAQRAEIGMHELCHFWRDDPKVPVYHATEEWRTSPREDFANQFAWLCVMWPRTIRGVRELELHEL